MLTSQDNVAIMRAMPTDSLLKPAPISTERFTFDPSTYRFVAEISDLGPGFNFEQVWNDACDEGLTLVSHRSGTEVVCVVEHIERRDGDLLYWDLVPAKRNQRGLCSVRIFND